MFDPLVQCAILAQGSRSAIDQIDPTYLVIGGIVLLALIAILLFIKANIHICDPNEVLIFSGRRTKAKDGVSKGYRIIKGGRGFRYPVVERVDRMDLTTIPVPVAVRNAYSKGGIPLNIEGIANVKIAGEFPVLGNAVERLLGKRPQEVSQIAQDTLEGNLRGILATMTPEEVNEDRLKFAEAVTGEAEKDLNKLGFLLDTVQIQNVSDEVGYLDAIGRVRNSEVKRKAEVAEAENMAISREKQAEARRRAEVADAVEGQTIAEATTKLRIRQAELDGEARATEERASKAAEKAGVQAQQEVEVERLKLQQKTLEVDVIEPARAEKDAAELRARGEAATIREDGQAEIEILDKKIDLWRDAGKNARDLFLLQILPELLEKVTDTIQDVEIERLVVIDGGGGGGQGGLPRLFQQLAGSTPALLESLSASTGIDVAALLRGEEADGETGGDADDAKAPVFDERSTGGSSKKRRRRKNTGRPRTDDDAS